VYCPKLCRAACPVSQVEASETVTPWGKMSMAYFVARGDVLIASDRADEEHAATAWACTGCHACSERCEHDNEVADVLLDARAEYFALGAAPEAARRVVEHYPEREAALLQRRPLLDGGGTPSGTTAPSSESVPVLVGCNYVRHALDVANDALFVVSRLLRRPVHPVLQCCGAPLLQAGDRGGFAAAANRLVDEVMDAPLVVVDPGCAKTLESYSKFAIDRPKTRLFVDVVVENLERVPKAVLSNEPTPRYHDPCQLGRGLGRYDEPRRILEHIGGVPPLEFDRRREAADCSGAGGMLPVTRPATSKAMAEDRIAEHRARGGGPLVTACAGSLRRFGSSGEPASDLVSHVARALRCGPKP